jgi:hypothetical protein
VNFSLLNTLLVPSLSINLISQSKLDIKFYFSTENGYQVRSREIHELFLEARVIGRFYVVNQVREFNTALLAKKNLTTWHECLGHISVKHLQDMRDEKATGVKFSNNKVDDFKCDACTLGKMHRQPFKINRDLGQQFQEKYYTGIPVGLYQNLSTGVFTW